MSRSARRILMLVLPLLVTAAACGGPDRAGAPPSSVTPATGGASASAVVDKATIDRGRRLAKAKACLSCHSIDGREMLGPTWRGLFGSAVDIEGGAAVEVDDAYLRQSITDPSSMIVKGFDDLMTVTKLTDDEVSAIIAYIKILD